MKYSYQWLKWYIPEAPDPEKLSDLVTYHLAEVESVERFIPPRPSGIPPRLVKEGAGGGDYILDIKILPNRAHDLLSHQGLARELASLLNISFTDPTPKYKIPESKPTNLKIEVTSDKCRRYIGRIIRNVKVGPSPDWVIKHLESIGQRSINNIVDAANLVMFDCGQPTHAFDLDKVQEKIIVRNAKEGEHLVTLDNRDLELRNSDMIIADAVGALGVAGIKGGKSTEVDARTKNLIIEVANFDPVSVRKTAQSLGIFTDARKRFENNLSPELAPYAMTELSALIVEMCPEAEFEEVVDTYPEKQEAKKLKFSIEKISKILGVEISGKEVEEILKRYVIKYVNKESEFEITVPPLRLDLNIEEDMAEEIGRILGYNKVKAEIPKINLPRLGKAGFKPKVNETYEKIQKVRQYLLSQGFNEIMTYSFHSKGKVEVVASASDKKFLRESLMGVDRNYLEGGFQNAIGLNSTILPLLGVPNYFKLKIFEIGTIWVPKEEIHVAVFDGTSKNMEGQEFLLDDYYKNIPSDFKLDPRPYTLAPNFKMWSLFPFIARDIALWVPKEVESYKVEKLIKENSGGWVVRGPEKFDEFKKGDKISYAFRIVFQSFERTLTDEEVNKVMEKVKAAVEANGWEVR